MARKPRKDRHASQQDRLEYEALGLTPDALRHAIQEFIETTGVRITFQDGSNPQIHLHFHGDVMAKNEEKGDRFENIGAGATIINRSSLRSALVNVGKSGGSDAVKALETVSQQVEASNNAAAGALLNSFNAELQKSQPDKSVLRQCWDGLVSVLPSIATLADAVGKITKLFD
jgi:hypothetical protein